jgi:hypothetical protein
MLKLFFNLHPFSAIEIFSQDAHFTAQYFIDHIAIPFVQDHSIHSGDISRQQLQLHFDNCRCYTATVVQEQIKLLRCKRVPHPAHSPGFVIANFYLFGKIKEGLRTMQASSGDEILEAVNGILKIIFQPELKSAFDHCMHQRDWVVTYNGEYYQE